MRGVLTILGIGILVGLVFGYIFLQWMRGVIG